MSAIAIESHSSLSSPPATIPPRTSSHGVTHTQASPPSAPAEPSSSALEPGQTPVSPPRRSSKRPVSTTSENWLAQSLGKKPLTASNLESVTSAERLDGYSAASYSGHKRNHSHSHRPKSSANAAMDTTLLSAKPAIALGSSPPPVQNPPKNIGDEIIHTEIQPWSDEQEGILLAPYDYLFGHPGKDIRGQIISAFNEWLKVPDERLAVITKVIGMLQTASLLVDDVEDNSVLRRGVPVAHNVFGMPQTINSANYVYFLALQELSTLNNPRVIQIFTEELINLHRGQGMDLFWRDTLTCPTEKEYLEMVSNKTGGLFRLAIRIMQAESTVLNESAGLISSADQAGASSSTTSLTCVPLINTIGMLFQVLDDHLNLHSSTYTARKGHAEDLTEGKFSFPVIHAIRSDPSNRVLLNILRQKTTDLEVKKYAVEYMDQRGSFEYTRRVLHELEKKAVKEIGRLEALWPESSSGGEKIRAILGKLKAL